MREPQVGDVVTVTLGDTEVDGTLNMLHLTVFQQEALPMVL